MKFYKAGTFNKVGCLVIDKVDFSDSYISKLVRGLNKEYIADLEILLRKVGNEGIANIDTYRMEYSVGDTLLAFEDLSTAERIFLIACVAHFSKRNICITGQVKQLDMGNLELFIETFKASDYVDIYLPYEDNLFEVEVENLIRGASYG